MGFRDLITEDFQARVTQLAAICHSDSAMRMPRMPRTRPSVVRFQLPGKESSTRACRTLRHKSLFSLTTGDSSNRLPLLNFAAKSKYFNAPMLPRPMQGYPAGQCAVITTLGGKPASVAMGYVKNSAAQQGGKSECQLWRRSMAQNRRISLIQGL